MPLVEFESHDGKRVAIKDSQVSSVHEYVDEKDEDETECVLVSLDNGVELHLSTTYEDFMDRISEGF